MGINPEQDLTLMQAVRLGFASYHTLYRLVRANEIPFGYEGRLRVIRVWDLLVRFGEPEGEDPHQLILGARDLADRWGISLQAVNKRMKEDRRFPEPLGKVNRGRFPVWDESDIKCYEALGKRPQGLRGPGRDRIYDWLAQKKPWVLRRFARGY